MKPIPYATQDITEAEVSAVSKLLLSDFLTQGPTVEKFEKEFALQAGVEHAVAVTNATAGLHIACLALELGKGDTLWTSPNSFVASSNCGLYCGSSVDFVDIDPRTYNLDPVQLEKKLAEAKRTGKLPKVLVVVHFAGQSANMAKIRELSLAYGFFVIEDASHAVGGSYRGKPVGNCEFSDMAVFSFHPVKIITTGEGGVVTTRKPELAKRLRQLRSHGITRAKEEMSGASGELPWAYEQQSLGFNYRITDIQCALGLIQLQRLDGFRKRRQEIFGCYNSAFSGVKGITLPFQNSDATSAHHLYVVQVDPARRLEIFLKLRALGILVNVHYIPIYLQPYYQELGFKPGLCPESEKYYSGALSLPMFTKLTNDEQDYVIKGVRSLL